MGAESRKTHNTQQYTNAQARETRTTGGKTIKTKISYTPAVIEDLDFVETHLCKLCVILRSRVLHHTMLSSIRSHINQRHLRYVVRGQKMK